MFKGRTYGATRALIALIFVFYAISCGGGGGGYGSTDTVAPDPPVLTEDSGVQPDGTVSGSVTLKATASDNSGTVARVEFLVASSPTLACADSTPKPSGSVFQCVWNTSDVTNGAHELTIRAYDAANNSNVSGPFRFSVQNPQLTVTKSGTGSGTVSSDDSRINCGTRCTATYPPNTPVTLSATPDPDSRFDGWSGDCTGTNPTVQVTMDADKTCTATFSLIPRTLQVTVVGSGSVTLTPPGTVCTSSCSETYNSGDPVTLSAEPASGYAFVNWSGDCSGTSPTVQVTMDADKTCTATFSQTFLLAVTKSGSGSGSVSSSPAGISCGQDCDERFAEGQNVTLTATPDSGSRFAGWGGDCSGTTSPVMVLMNSDKTCEAIFIRTHVLRVTLSGSGSVTSNPAGINCGDACSATYDEGTVVELTATPNPGATFLGWSGAECSGTGTCQVTMDADKSVTASFSVIQRTLNVVRAGSGTGTVNSSPEGISCGNQCFANFDDGSTVTLTATADAGSRFDGWSGDCTGTNPTVQVTMDADKTCTATFIRQRTLSVTRAGTGSGTVSSNPSGINCGTTCNAVYDEGTLVTLMATPDSTSTFTGWSGAGCSGTGFCQVTMDADKSVTATFTRKRFTVTVTKSGTGTGTVQSAPPGIQCGATCTAEFDAGAQITLTATPDSGSSFGGWSGPCSGTGTCQFTVNGNTTVGAVFNASQVTITINKTGSGVVVSTVPPGIRCGRTCELTVNSGTQVTLTAQPGPANQSFLGWNGGGCSGTGNCIITPTTDVTITATFTNTISYTNDIQPIWEQSHNGSTCVNCHGGSGGLYLNPPASASHAQLVDKTMNHLACLSKKRVLPDDPQNSGLILKLTGTTCGSRMPQGGPPLTQSTIDKIIAWIMAGAPLN